MHTRLIELLQTSGGVHYDETNTLHPDKQLTTVTRNEFYSQIGFGALAHTFNTTTRPLLPGTKYPVAFVWDARRVQIEGEDTPPQLEIISIAVAVGWLQHPDRLPGYAQALSFDGHRDIPLAMQPDYGFHKLAVFTHPDYKGARTTRAKRSTRRKDQTIAEMKAQIARLTKLVEDKL